MASIWHSTSRSIRRTRPSGRPGSKDLLNSKPRRFLKSRRNPSVGNRQEKPACTCGNCVHRLPPIRQSKEGCSLRQAWPTGRKAGEPRLWRSRHAAAPPSRHACKKPEKQERRLQKRTIPFPSVSPFGVAIPSGRYANKPPDSLPASLSMAAIMRSTPKEKRRVIPPYEGTTRRSEVETYVMTHCARDYAPQNTPTAPAPHNRHSPNSRSASSHVRRALRN